MRTKGLDDRTPVPYRASMAQNVRSIDVPEPASMRTCEYQLVTVAADESRLETRFEIARFAYNALLHESLRRLELMRESKAYSRCQRMSRGSERTRSFRDLRARYGLTGYSLDKWATSNVNHTWIGPHLGSQPARMLGRRALRATLRYQIGLAGRPRYRRQSEIESIEGESPKQSLRLMGDRLVWSGLALRIRLGDVSTQTIDTTDVRRIRIVRRRLRGRTRFYLQLVYRGRAPSPILGSRVVGVDPGPRHFGIVTSTTADVIDLAIAAPIARIRRTQRSIERKRRLRNPHMYVGDRQIRRGHHGQWTKSARQRRVEDRLAEIHRQVRERRRCAQNRAANRLVGLGSEFRIERTTFAGFRSRYRFAIRDACPQGFISKLVRKAVNSGGKVTMLPAQLGLSRWCHGCGRSERKSLALRTHKCACGIGPIQRDVYSAWLATVATPSKSTLKWMLDADQALKAWSGAEPRLLAVSNIVSLDEFARRAQVASGRLLLPASPSGTERLASEGRTTRDEARDDVGIGRGPERVALVAAGEASLRKEP